MRQYHSQFGEDKWIQENIKPPVGIFVDVGASDGIYLSNTYFFETMGWVGWCFEPNPRSFAKCEGVRAHALPYAVGLKDEVALFNLDVKEPDLSGFKQFNREYQTIKVQVHRLDTMMETLKIPRIDLLSIDTEGTELDVLQSFDMAKVLPKIVIVEHWNQHNENTALVEFFAKLPYKKVLETTANYIYQLHS